MTIPSNADFDEWLTRADATIDLPVQLPPDTEISEADAIAYLSVALPARTDSVRELLGMPAMRWLEAAREFQRAKAIVTRPGRGGRRAEPLNQKAVSAEERYRALYRKAVDDAHRYGASHEYLPTRDIGYWLHRTISAAPFPKYTWLHKTVASLSEYLYSGRGDGWVEAAREIELAAQEAAKAAARYWQLARHVDSLEALRPGWRSRRAEHDHERGHVFRVPPADIFPFTRRDDNNAERLFVYRMAIANLSASRSAKPEAIVELMGLV